MGLKPPTGALQRRSPTAAAARFVEPTRRSQGAATAEAARRRGPRRVLACLGSAAGTRLLKCAGRGRATRPRLRRQSDLPYQLAGSPEQSALVDTRRQAAVV